LDEKLLLQEDAKYQVKNKKTRKQKTNFNQLKKKSLLENSKNTHLI